MMYRILVVEDDEVLNNGIRCCMADESMEVFGAFNCRQTEELILTNDYDLFVLDVNLPDGNGFELCNSIKKRFPEIPVLFLTARDFEDDVVKGFNLGADDYVTKPFSVNILKKKILAILKRYQRASGNIYIIKDLKVDFDKKEVYKCGELINLTPTEYRIICLLIADRGKVTTKDVIIEYLYDKDGEFIDDHTLSVYMSRLRNKIEGGGESFIKTIYGMGYMWIES